MDGSSCVSELRSKILDCRCLSLMLWVSSPLGKISWSGSDVCEFSALNAPGLLVFWIRAVFWFCRLRMAAPEWLAGSPLNLSIESTVEV